MPFPSRECADQPDADSPRSERRQSRERVEIGARPSRIEPVEIHGVVNRMHRHAGAESLARLGGHALGIGQHRIASMRLAREQPRRQAPRRRIVVQVPHELRVGRPHPRAEKVHLQTVAVNDVGVEITKPLLQASRIDDGRRRSRQKSCAEAEAGGYRSARPPFPQPGQRVRERHRRGVGICGGFRDERAVRMRQSSRAPSRGGPRESRRACRATQSPLPRARRSG